MIDASEYFPEVSEQRIRRGLSELSEGRHKQAVVTLGVSRVDLNIRKTQRRNQLIRSIRHKHFSELDERRACFEISTRMKRYFASDWPRMRTKRHNPHHPGALEYLFWECLRTKKTPIGFDGVRGIIREKT